MRNIIEPRHNIKPFDIKDYTVLKFKKHDMENIKKFYPFFKSRMIDIATQKAFGSSFMLATRQASEQKGRYFHCTYQGRLPLSVLKKEASHVLTAQAATKERLLAAIRLKGYG